MGKNEKWKLIVFFVFLQLIGLVLQPIPLVHAEKVSATKKIISVVYDDSGSMCSDGLTSWSEANYAMQAFAALLNEQDEMYITYMSDITYGTKGVETIDLTNIESAVKQIREDDRDFGDTPLESVDIAMNKLTSIQTDDENTQFWLVVLTDGQMFQYESAYTNLQESLNDYAGTTMCNGSQVYINYMGIGTNAEQISGDPGAGFETVQAGDDIVSALSDIANKISGRMEFESSQITQKDGKTLNIHSDIPLYAISVFSQGVNAKVEKAVLEADLNVDRNVALKYPEEKHGAITNTSLFGNAALISNGDKVIPAGDYTITFSEDISLDNTVVMFQPAIAMKAQITVNGIEVESTDELGIGEVADIELIPTNPDTGEVIPDSKLPAGISWSVSYSVNDQIVDQADGKVLSGVTIAEGENKIICTMQIPDFVPARQTITFSPIDPIVYGIETVQPDKVEYGRNDLGLKGTEGEEVTFWITGDGVRLTKEELGKLSLEIEDITVNNDMVEGFLDRFGMKKASADLKVNDDGSITLYPKNTVFPAFMLKAGQYTVTVALDSDGSVQAEGTYMLTASMADWMDLVPVIVGLLLLIYLIYIFFIKAKFDGQTLKIQVYASAGAMGGGRLLSTQGDEVILKKFGKDLFAPKGACTKTVSGIKVIADGSGGAYIPKRTIMGYEAYGNSAVNPIINYNGIAGVLKVVRGKEEQVPDMISLGGTPFYLKQGGRLYRITLE